MVAIYNTPILAWPDFKFFCWGLGWGWKWLAGWVGRLDGSARPHKKNKYQLIYFPRPACQAV
jgi:hypothetical protein